MEHDKSKKPNQETPPPRDRGKVRSVVETSMKSKNQKPTKKNGNR